jgi:hypothetical protein
MKQNEFSLESNWFYRLIKVAYGFFLIIAGLIGLIIIAIINEWLWGMLWLCASYTILSVFKEALIYVAFGRPFSWAWLTGIKDLLVK